MELGILVEITDAGKTYTTYEKWLEVKAKEYIDAYKKVNPARIREALKGNIVAKGYHHIYKKRNLYLVITEEGPILIEEEGIKMAVEQLVQ
mgnify:FL=1